VAARRALCRFASPLPRPGPRCSRAAAGRPAHLGHGVQRGHEVHLRSARDTAKDLGVNVIATVADTASGVKPLWERKNARPWVTQPDLLASYRIAIASTFSRWSREPHDAERRLREWAEENGKTILITDKLVRWPPRAGIHYDDDVSAWNRAAEEAHREWATISRRYQRMHRNLDEHGYVNSKVPYGYRTQGVVCGKSPCLCAEEGIDDHTVPVIYEPEARVFREAVHRYLNCDEGLQDICDAFNANLEACIPPSGGKWTVSNLARLLRKPSLAGRRIKNGKTTARYEGIIDWPTHLQVVAKLDSKAYRKGKSPTNAYMLTGSLSDQAGHSMSGSPTKTRYGRINLYYRCSNGCRRNGRTAIMVPMGTVDDDATAIICTLYGDRPHRVRQTIPGKNHSNEIAQLRQDRNELDETELGAAEYDRRHAELSAEIRRLMQLDKEHPDPPRSEWVPSGQTVAEHWNEAIPAKRRNWLRDVERTFTVCFDDDGWWITTVRRTSIRGQAAKFGALMTADDVHLIEKREREYEPVRHAWKSRRTAA